jgi:hypothetical protein
MNLILKVSLALSALLLIYGCETAHQPYSYFGGGGYKDIQLSEDTYKVTVEANGYTSGSKATNLALMRASELTLERGYKYFIIVSSDDNTYSTTYTTPTTTSLTANVIGNTVIANSQTYGGQSYNFSFPTPSLTFVIFKEKPLLTTAIYDAEITFKSIKKQLGIK